MLNGPSNSCPANPQTGAGGRKFESFRARQSDPALGTAPFERQIQVDFSKGFCRASVVPHGREPLHTHGISACRSPTPVGVAAAPVGHRMNLGIMGILSASVGFWLHSFPNCSILPCFERGKPDSPDWNAAGAASIPVCAEGKGTLPVARPARREINNWIDGFHVRPAFHIRRHRTAPHQSSPRTVLDRTFTAR